MCAGGGPILGGGPRGVGQPGAAASANEAAGGVSQDVCGAVFCGEYKHPWSQSWTRNYPLRRKQLYCFSVKKLVVKSAFCAASLHCAGLIQLRHRLIK